MAGNLDKTNRPGAADNLYSDIILARQEKNAPERLGAGDVTPLIEFSIKMQQLLDQDAAAPRRRRVQGREMMFTIEFFRMRKEDDAHATLDRITHRAPDLESAKVKARSLFDTLNMPQNRPSVFWP